MQKLEDVRNDLNHIYKDMKINRAKEMYLDLARKEIDVCIYVILRMSTKVLLIWILPIVVILENYVLLALHDSVIMPNSDPKLFAFIQLVFNAIGCVNRLKNISYLEQVK